MSFRLFLRGMVLASLLLPAMACSQGGLPPFASAQISPYNHTPDYIDEISIDGQGGGNSRAYGGGGSFVCCIMYPRQWHKGLKATVRWKTSSSDPRITREENIILSHEKVVPIERYEKTGTRLNVHFLPEGEVRLIIWNGVAGTPGYPGPNAPDPPPDWPPWLHAGSSSVSQEKSPLYANAKIRLYNHTPDRIGRLTVEGEWTGGLLHPYEAQEKKICCVAYPIQWRNDYKVNLHWMAESGDHPRDSEKAYDKNVSIERYEKEGGTLDVHLLPNGEVRLIISHLNPGAPGYPGPGFPERPSGDERELSLPPVSPKD